MNQMTSHPFPVIDIDAHPPFSSLPIDHLGELTQSRFFGRLIAAGIDIACGRLLPPQGFFEAHAPGEAIALLNSAALTLAKSDSRYRPSLWIHPDCPDASVSQLEESRKSGARLFELDAPWLSHPGLTPILSAAQALGMTAVLHGEKIDQADELAARFPALPLLVGGSGSAGYMPAPAEVLLKKHENLSVNLSGVIWGCNYALHEWCSRLGPDRLFFGSGYPFSNPAGRLAAFQWELRDQPDSVREQIFGKNALRLVGAEGGPAWK